MTRETRIGLVVGLAFIVMFGLVLSELMNSKAPRTTAVVDDAPPLPINTVPQQAQPVPAPPSHAQPIRHDVPASFTAVAGAASPPAPRSQQLQDQHLAAAPVRQQTDINLLAATSSSRREPQPPSQPQPRNVTYRVKPGDSLYKIAQAFYGPDNGHKYVDIYRANKAILPDESTLTVGQELVIPVLQQTQAPAGRGRSASVASFVGSGYREMDLSQLQRALSATGGGRAATETQHVVREGDSLSRIAGRYLGDSSRTSVMKIFNANRDKLSSPDELQIGMRLTIPR